MIRAIIERHWNAEPIYITDALIKKESATMEVMDDEGTYTVDDGSAPVRVTITGNEFLPDPPIPGDPSDDAKMLAFAVLRGDHDAALALADEVLMRYQEGPSFRRRSSIIEENAELYAKMEYYKARCIQTITEEYTQP